MDGQNFDMAKVRTDVAPASVLRELYKMVTQVLPELSEFLWQQSSSKPVGACKLLERIIHVQAGNRGTTRRGETDKRFLIRRPRKVLVPELLSRMKQSRFLTGDRIAPYDTIGFSQVARGASQSAVGLRIGPTQGDGNNVLQVEVISAGILGCSAVFAAEISQRLDPST
jgi:hypothetical protein